MSSLNLQDFFFIGLFFEWEELSPYSTVTGTGTFLSNQVPTVLLNLLLGKGLEWHYLEFSTVASKHMFGVFFVFPDMAFSPSRLMESGMIICCPNSHGIARDLLCQLPDQYTPTPLFPIDKP